LNSFVVSVLFLILKQPASLQLPSFTPNLTTVTLYTIIFPSLN